MFQNYLYKICSSTISAELSLQWPQKKAHWNQGIKVDKDCSRWVYLQKPVHLSYIQNKIRAAQFPECMINSLHYEEQNNFFLALTECKKNQMIKTQEMLQW